MQYLSISLAKGMRERQMKKNRHMSSPINRKMIPDQICTTYTRIDFGPPSSYLHEIERDTSNAKVESDVEDERNIDELLGE